MGDWSIGARRRFGSLVCGATLSWFIACGGSAVVDGPSGSNNAAGSNGVAGASNLAGTSAIAGASPAAGSAGSSTGDACTASRESGQCDAYIPSFWHDPKTGVCEPFVYGGCGGNANRYPTRETCIERCPTLANDWAACVDDSNCALVFPGCCGGCEPVMAEQLVAINSSHEQEYVASHCGEQPPCAPCLGLPENEQTRKYFKPVCENARCTLLDIRESPITECQKTSDCMLRDGAACCAECDGSGWVPMNKSADLCGGHPSPCDACVSPPPSDWDVVCLGGRCRLEGPI